MENEKITVLERIRAKPGMEDLVKLILLQLAAETRTEEGCVSNHVRQSASDPGVFLSIETWMNRDCLERHSETSHIDAFRRKAEDLLAGPSEISLWENLD
ncbi:MAG: antibiotic biosynthesis monooxygenase [Acidobacteria bacterium]|nr:antibiotic biosynthesis monooxygenase [Acidobacteriota bacterium]MCL5287888.1 antibiotic biosynthesis monooxygenase [Acidobacteriota bacterium]